MSHQFRVAMLSLHSCPLGRPGTRDTGGMSIYVQNVAQKLGELGLAVDIFTRRHQPASPPVVPLAHRVRLIHLPLGDSQEKLELFASLPDFAGAIGRFREQEGLSYQLLHSHYWLSGWVGSTLSGRWQVPHVAMLHTSARAKNHHLGSQVDPQLRADTEQHVLDSAHRVVTATEREKQELVAFYGADAAKIVAIPCGVDPAIFRPLPRAWARPVLGLDSLPVILYVGRLQPEKGIEQLLEAVALLAADRAVQVMIVGGDATEAEEVERLRQRCLELGIDRCTRFRSSVDHEELPLYYSAADVLVLPSRYETFGLVAAEALACGTPVIASPVGAMPQLIQEGRNGFLLDSPSPAPLADRLRHLLGDDGLRQRLATSAPATVANLSWAAVAEKLAQEYYRLAGLA